MPFTLVFDNDMVRIHIRSAIGFGISACRDKFISVYLWLGSTRTVATWSDNIATSTGTGSATIPSLKEEPLLKGQKNQPILKGRTKTQTTSFKILYLALDGTGSGMQALTRLSGEKCFIGGESSPSWPKECFPASQPCASMIISSLDLFLMKLTGFESWRSSHFGADHAWGW